MTMIVLKIIKFGVAIIPCNLLLRSILLCNIKTKLKANITTVSNSIDFFLLGGNLPPGMGDLPLVFVCTR